MTEQPDYEVQLAAMRAVMEALRPLDEQGRNAVLSWVNGQFGTQAAPPTKLQSADATSIKREGTVSVVAQKISAQSARDLLLASALHLTLYQEKDRFSRDELVACAKEARGWKAAYSNQIAVNIKRMSDAGILLEKSKDVFGLADATLEAMEGRLS